MPQESESNQRLLTIEQSATRLGISRAALYPRVMSGELKSILIGTKTRRVAIEDLEAFVQHLRAGLASRVRKP